MAENKQTKTFFYTRDDEDKLIGIIQSDAELKEKCDALREIGRVGTVKSVAPLATLLGDSTLAHRARYALEMLPFPEVDEALRKALGEQKDSRLAGVIMSLGKRRDTASVSAIAGHLSDSNPEVVLAAAYALGDIGTQEAVDALESALPEARGMKLGAICEALLRAADSLRAAGWDENALAIYDRLRILKQPRHVREAALVHSVELRS